MRFLDERRARASGRATPQRLRWSLASLLAGLALTSYLANANQEAIEQAEHLEQRAHESAQREALRELSAYQSVRNEAQQRASGDAQPASPEALLEQRVLPLLSPAAEAKAAAKLAEQDRQLLSSTQRRMAVFSGLFGLVLVRAQVDLARKTRRLLSPPLLAATALVFWIDLVQWKRASEVMVQLTAGQVTPSSSGATGLALPVLAFAAVLLWLGFWQRWREFE